MKAPPSLQNGELLQETGAEISSLTFLGDMAPDSGILMSVVPIYLAEVSSQGDRTPDHSEAIAGNPSYTLSELKALFKEGEVSIALNGETIIAHVRDPFLAYALFLAEIQNHLGD